MDSRNQCQVCFRDEAKYVCPRCNIPYCSLPCYQSERHVQCSESFYKDCVVEQIRDEQLDPDSQQRMMEILQRIQQIDSEVHDEAALDSDDADSIAELADRIADVDLDDADSVWERLTEEEKQEFQQLVTSGDVSELLPQWNPWWNYTEKKKLVEELNENIPSENDAEPLHMRYSIKQVVPPLSKLSKVAPSPIVRWNLANVLAAYALTARMYNGDLQSSAAVVLTTVSENLAFNQNFDSVDLAVTSVQMVAANNGYFLEGIDGSMLKEDVKILMEGPSKSRRNEYVLVALSDIHSLLTNAKLRLKNNTTLKSTGEFSKKFPDSENSKESKFVSSKDINKHIKKIEFLLSWVQEYF